MASDGKHYGSSDEVRGFGRAMAQNLRQLTEYSGKANSLLGDIESADKGNSYQEARQIVEEVLRTVQAGLPDIEDTYKKLNAYANYLESIGK